MDQSDDINGRIQWLEHIWLVSLFFVFFPLIFTPDSTTTDWLVTGAMVAAFLVLYLWAELVEGRAALVPLALIGVLGVAGAYVNSGTTVFLIFLSAFAAHALPTRRALWVVAGLAATVVVIGLTLDEPMPYGLASVTPAFIFVIVIGLAEIYSAQRERADARLGLAQEEIERLATVAERERIARDLHDLLGHTLSVIVLKAELASRLHGPRSGACRDRGRRGRAHQPHRAGRGACGGPGLPRAEPGSRARGGAAHPVGGRDRGRDRDRGGRAARDARRGAGARGPRGDHEHHPPLVGAQRADRVAEQQRRRAPHAGR